MAWRLAGPWPGDFMPSGLTSVTARPADSCPSFSCSIARSISSSLPILHRQHPAPPARHARGPFLHSQRPTVRSSHSIYFGPVHDLVLVLVLATRHTGVTMPCVSASSVLQFLFSILRPLVQSRTTEKHLSSRWGSSFPSHTTSSHIQYMTPGYRATSSSDDRGGQSATRPLGQVYVRDTYCNRR